MSGKRTYIAIDLKSFYASAECVARGLDPLSTHLVVADPERTDKTICLAVSPSLKAYGIPGRARLFEVVREVDRINAERARRCRLGTASSPDANALAADPSLRLDYIVAPPRMAYYMQVSAQIYGIYLRHISADDIHVYSIDEVFIDATDYLRLYRLSAHDLTRRLIRDVLAQTGITATAGIGPNLYLAKIAMDIEAKHAAPDRDGVRIAELDEMSFRRKYWTHRPLTDFWRIGHGIAARLEANGLYTLGDVARCSLGKPWMRHSEELLYQLFGVNAELLIDHAWGWEPCTMRDIKSYRAAGHSLGSGQVLMEPYSWEKARLIVREMTDALVLDLVGKRLVTDQIILSINYDGTSPAKGRALVRDWYGREVPKPAHGSVGLNGFTSSTRRIMDAVMDLYDRIVEKDLFVRRIGVTAAHVLPEETAPGEEAGLFDAPLDRDKERSRQEAILAIRRKFGKNAILKGMNFEEGATAALRNRQIGGHKA